MALIEKLIEFVARYPILYDLENENYKNIREKDKVWKEIGSELGKDGEELKKKWKNLRDSYAKYLRSLKTTTGQAAKQKLAKWQWVKQMEIFRPFMSFAKTESNVRDITREENSDGELNSITNKETISQSPLYSNQPDDLTADIEGNNGRKETDELSTSLQTPVALSKKIYKSNSNKRIRKNEDAESPTASVIKYLKEKSNHNDNSMDAIDFIFSGYAKTVKKFAPRLQITAKLKLAQLMSQLELEHEQEGAGSLASISNDRCSSRVSNNISCTTPQCSPSCLDSCDFEHSQHHRTASCNADFQIPISSFSANQIFPLETGTLQNQSQFTYNQPCSPDSHSITGINSQSLLESFRPSPLYSYVSNYNPNE